MQVLDQGDAWLRPSRRGALCGTSEVCCIRGLARHCRSPSSPQRRESPTEHRHTVLLGPSATEVRGERSRIRRRNEDVGPETLQPFREPRLPDHLELAPKVQRVVVMQPEHGRQLATLWKEDDASGEIRTTFSENSDQRKRTRPRIHAFRCLECFARRPLGLSPAEPPGVTRWSV